jgi:DNA-binding NarL/FixJ family response regulator
VAALRILICDDHRVVADAVARLLQTDPSIEVLGVATTGPEAIALACLLRPSLILMDIGLPGMDGVEATWTLRRQLPDMPVLILTMFEQEAYVVEAIRAGAAGYLLKTSTPAELIDAIHAVCAGRGLVYPHAPASAFARARSARAGDLTGLTGRELQVLQMAIAGVDIAETARRMLLSPHTVKNHLRTVYRKLGVRNRTEAAIHALRRGLIKA